MLRFSADGNQAELQMRAVIFYLTTFGYIDGDFDDAEKSFVRAYVTRLVEHRVEQAEGLDAATKLEISRQYVTHFLEVFEGIDREVRDLFTEAVSEGEDQDTFVHAKLKLRCFEIFQSFDSDGREQLLASVDELIHADGSVHPAEAKFRAELTDLLNEELGVELLMEEVDKPVRLGAPQTLWTRPDDHPFLAESEQHYSDDQAALATQVASDRSLLDRAIESLAKRRAQGEGRLKGVEKVGDVPRGADFLDGHVQVLMPKPGASYELIVVGDLHGCYSCLKAAITQTNFLAKVEAHRRAPDREVCPRLVLLGDYIDRGIFSYQGVLRAVLQLYLAHPEYVVPLRGNHEYYIEHQGRVYGAVRPSEAMDRLRPHLSEDVFQHYIRLFESLPAAFLFEQFLFVHGGIPKDSTIKAKYKDLSSLNDWDIRFQMMWSDPSQADVIPAALQDQSARFPFGRLQAQAFLQRIGCHTMFRGHEKVEEGFRRSIETPAVDVFTVFSSGGRHNDDLPPESSYRSVEPMACCLRFQDGVSTLAPFAIDYESFNDASRNRFYQAPETLR